MTRDETIKILMVIQAAYPNFKVPDKTVAVNIWYSMLSDYTYEQVSTALNVYIRTDISGFAPSIGEIIDKLSQLYQGEEMGEIEAWGLIVKAIRNSSYHAEDEFDKLPPILQKTVSTPQNLREMAMTEGTDGKSWSVLQSNIMRTYRSVQAQERELKKVNTSILKAIGKMYEAKQLKDKNYEKDTVEEKTCGVKMPERAKQKLKEFFPNVEL